MFRPFIKEERGLTLRRVLFALCFLIPVFSQCAAYADAAGETRPACPPKKQLAAQLEDKISQLRDTKERLVSLIAGQDLSDVPPSAIFTVDLVDEEAVARRIKELAARVAVGTLSASEMLTEEMPCLRIHADLASRVEEARSLEDEVDILRLQFLSLPLERRVAFVNAQKAVVLHTEAVQRLELERSAADLQKIQALKSIELARERAKTAASAALRELGAQRALLEKTREDLATIKGRWAFSLQERGKVYQAYAENLSRLNAVLYKDSTLQEVRDAYSQVVTVWRQLVDGIFVNIAEIGQAESLPEIPSYPSALLEQLNGSPDAQAYIKANAEVRNQYGTLVELRDKRFDAERDNAYRLLLQAGKLRSDLLKKTVAMGDTSPLDFSKAYFSDLSREIRVVPYREIAIVYAKFMDIRHKLGTGLEGIIDIIKQIFVLSFVIALPFLTFHLLRKLTERLNQLRRNLLRRQFVQDGKQRRFYGGIALWIQRINPYLPWMIMLLGLRFAEELIATTDLAEVASLLPYLEYYIWYRIFLNVIVAMVGLVAYSGSSRVVTGIRDRVQRTSREVGLFFLVAMIVMHATNDVVGEALVYHIVYWLMVYVGAFVCFYAAQHWRAELIHAAENMLPQVLAGLASRYCRGWTAWFVSLPVLLLIILYYLGEKALKLANHLDFFKRIGSEIFRRRIESAVGKNERAGVQAGKDLSAEYLQYFDLGPPADPALLIEPTNGIVDSLLEKITRWREGETGENSLAVYGSKGSGKTSLFNIVEQHVESERVFRLSVPPKLYTREAVYQFFAKELGFDYSRGVTASKEGDPPAEKILVLVDEAQNMFLSALGCFEGYKAFLELINAEDGHVFWLANFNHRSWDYLLGVFKGHQYFSSAMEMPPLNEEDIQRLIMARHRRASFKLSYDAIIRATQNMDEYTVMEQIEAQFFRLLWRQSKGNPRAALVLWLSALRQISGNVLKVGIPQYSQLKGMELLNDDVMFVYAAIMRHENLSLAELVLTTGLPMATIKDAVKIGLDSEVIYKGDGGRFRVTPVDQYALEQLLIGKNFIYG